MRFWKRITKGDNVRSTNVFDECSSNECPTGEFGMGKLKVREVKKR